MRFLKVCVALGCLALWPGQGFAGEPQWLEVHSPNFSVITDAGEKRGRDVALHFEQMRSVFGTLMTKAQVNQSIPLQIVAFRNSREIRQMAPVFNGKPVEVAGLFQAGEDRCFIMLDMSVDNPWSVVFHEYAHQLMNSNLVEHTDPWFEEGFAEFFSSIEVDNREARVGKIPEDTYRILQQSGMMKVADLFRVQQNSKTYNENGDHRSTFYAESSLVVHFLYDSQLTSKLVDYFDAVVNQKKPVERAIELAFAMTSDQFDKALRNYLSGGRYKYFPIPTPSGIVAAQFAVTPVSLADARAVLADIDAHSLDHHDRALAEFQDVLKLDPNNASALRGAGYAYLQVQDIDHAEEYFRRAAARDTQDPRVHYYTALLMSRSGATLSAAQSEEMKKELEAAIALDPKLADAYSLLAYAQAASGEPEKALTTMRKAYELAPRNETYIFNLANVYLTNHKVDDAILILRSLAGSSNPEVASRARTILAQAENFKQQSALIHQRAEKQADDPEDVKAGSDSGSNGGNVQIVTLEGAPAPSARIQLLEGKLAAVDCSVPPQAFLTVVSAGRRFQMHVDDSKHIVLIGADAFSCAWKNKKVSVNYRERQDGGGDVVSLEIR